MQPARIRRAAILLAMMAGAPLCAVARDHVTVVGSSTVFPFASAVAEAFSRQGRWKAPVVESVGTGSGFKLFCAGAGLDTPDITDASRPLSSAESADCLRHGVDAIVGIRVGLDGILLANARSGARFRITREQLYRAVARQVPIGGRLVANPYRRWSQIAPELPDQPITVIGPAPNHGTRDAFVALVMTPPCERLQEIRALSQDARMAVCQTVREDGAWIDMPGDYAVTLGKLLADPNAVGVIGFSYLDRNRDRIQAASVDGVAPTIESISEWKYPLARPLFIYVKQNHIGAIPGLAEFVREFVSERAAGPEGYLVDKGLMPLPAAWRSVERAKAEKLK